MRSFVPGTSIIYSLTKKNGIIKKRTYWYKDHTVEWKEHRVRHLNPPQIKISKLKKKKKDAQATPQLYQNVWGGGRGGSPGINIFLKLPTVILMCSQPMVKTTA